MTQTSMIRLNVFTSKAHIKSFLKVLKITKHNFFWGFSGYGQTLTVSLKTRYFNKLRHFKRERNF